MYTSNIANSLKQLSTVTLLLFSLNSCITKIAMTTMGIFDTKALEKHIYNGEKQITFIPMHHIGKAEFYNDVKLKLDSLHKLGYTVFFETIRHSPKIDSLTKDTLLRKSRKILGSLYATGYLNSKEGTIMGRKFSFVKELINQPKGADIGIDSTVDIQVDVYLHELIAAYEKKYNSIELDTCDFATAMLEKFTCNKIRNKEARIFFMEGYRNKYIANAVSTSALTKIAMLYGGRHFGGITDSLKIIDSRWKEIQH